MQFTTGALTNKFLVSGEFVQFQNSGNALIFDPYTGEIKTSASDETLLLNYNNLGDINLGKNGVFIDNDSSAPKIGIGHAIPAYTMHVSGAVAQVSRFQTNQTVTNLSLRNSTNIGYIGLSANKIFIGTSAALSTSNAIIDVAGNFGLGTTSPQFKLDVATNGATDYTVGSFQSTAIQGTTQVVIAANKNTATEATIKRNSLLTFSRFHSAINIPKWSIGNGFDPDLSGASDDFVFIKDGYFGAAPDVVAKLTKAGSLDIDGSYTTASSYCKGQYIQVHTASLAGTSHIYIDPFGTNASSASNNSNIVGNAPFGVAMYAGSLQRIRFSVTSVSPIANVIFQFYAITPAATGSSTTNNIGDTTDTANVKYTTTIALLVAGTTTLDIPTSHSFSAGQLLQFRLFTVGPVALNVVVQMTSSFRYIIV